jgi:ubiquinone/menaquinone biosynthesis C-methylase UbiE
MTGSPDYPGKTRYHGAEAQFYNRKWTGSLAKRRLWSAEVAIVSAILGAVPKGFLFLDAASGTGRYLPVLSSLDVAWVATDISRDMLRQVPDPGSGAGKGVVQADLEHLPFVDASFGYVLCLKLFQLLPMEVARQVLSEFARVCSRGVVLELPLSDDAGLGPAARSTNSVARVLHQSQSRWAPTIRSMRGLLRRTRRRRAGTSPFFDAIQSGTSGQRGVRGQSPSRLSDIAELATSCGLRLAAVQPISRSRWTFVILEPLGSHWMDRDLGERGTTRTRARLERVGRRPTNPKEP